MSELKNKYEIQNLAQKISEEDSFTPFRYRQFQRHFTKGTRFVLDVGCNTGRGGETLFKIDDNLIIHGLDCVSERLDRLPACYRNKILGLSTDIPLPDRSVDAITAGEFLEHLYPSDVDKTLAEFQRVLKIGGRILMTTPNPNYIMNQLKHRSVFGESHLTQHYSKILKIRMALHGFSSIKVRVSGRVSNFIGESIPLLFLYGSYILIADKY
jgi:ubiquinone/menaquinone biosynthesis C-methylase UbiE